MLSLVFVIVGPLTAFGGAPPRGSIQTGAAEFPHAGEHSHACADQECGHVPAEDGVEGAVQVGIGCIAT